MRPKFLIIVALLLAPPAAASANAGVTELDSALVDYAVASPSGPVADVTQRVTTLGSSEVTLMVAAFALALLAALRHWQGLLVVALAFAATEAAVFAAKRLVARPRPSEAIVDASGFSFPSGHAATAIALYGLLTFLAARACKGFARVGIAVAGGTLAVSIGVSRVVLGVHYPSDVIAGWLIAGAIAVSAWLVAEGIHGLVARDGGRIALAAGEDD